MIDALSIASSGLAANQAWIDSISNNVANMQTLGYKRTQVEFQDMVQQGAPGQSMRTTDAAAKASGAGIQVAGTTQVFTPGDMVATENQYDIAIEGKGFFEVETAGGALAYTRAGRFHVTADGRLALGSGQLLSADLRIPPDASSVKVAGDGMVTATLANTGEKITAGHIRLADFASAEQLNKLSDSLYQPTAASGEAVYAEPGTGGKGLLLQNHVEMSNVNLVDEMTGLVLAQRAYQLNARLLQASDQVLETINNLRR